MRSQAALNQRASGVRHGTRERASQGGFRHAYPATGNSDARSHHADSFGIIDNIVFETSQVQPAGTGNFNTFEQIQHNGFEQGYNTDGTKQFDTKSSAVFNHSVLLAQVPIVIGDGTNGTQDGVAYREFLLDLNEPNGGTKSFLSLDSLQIWQEESGSLTGFTPGAGFAGAHTNNLVYDLDAGGDNWVGLNAGLSRGSGQADIAILVPDSLFVNDGTDRFVYLYSAFGAQSGWDAGGGFEEWGTLHAEWPERRDQRDEHQQDGVGAGRHRRPGRGGDHLYDRGVRRRQHPSHQRHGHRPVGRRHDARRGHRRQQRQRSRPRRNLVVHRPSHGDPAELNVGTEGGVIVNTATATSDQTGPVSATTSVIVAPPGPDTTVDHHADGRRRHRGRGRRGDQLRDHDDEPRHLRSDRAARPRPEHRGPRRGRRDAADSMSATPTRTASSIPARAGNSPTATRSPRPTSTIRDGGGVPTVDPNLAHTLTVLGLFDQGDPVVATATTPIVQNPHVTLTKTASLGDGGTAADNAGDVINYAIGLANDGNMDLTNPMVTDPSVSDLAAVMAGGFNVGDTNNDGS